MKQPEQALGPFQEVARLEPKMARGFYELGHTYFLMKRPSDAMAALSKATALEPKHAQAHFGLGMVYRVLGRREDALREHETLKSLDAKLAEQLLNALNQASDTAGPRATSRPRTATTGGAAVAKGPAAIQSGEYDIADLRAHPELLEGWILQLKQDPTVRGYVIAYGGRTRGPDDPRAAGDNARAYAIQVHGVDPNRILVAVGGYREKPTVELWMQLEGGAEPPLRPTVDPKDVKPATQRR
jgi:tetratricopeptide (TPR) repeat protein